MLKEQIKRQAELLAKENRQSDPEISRIFWFQNEEEIRLVELHSTIPPSDDGQVHPFFFRPSPSKCLPAPSAIALIRSDEFRKLQLPPGWGEWNDAIELEEKE